MMFSSLLPLCGSLFLLAAAERHIRMKRSKTTVMQFKKAGRCSGADACRASCEHRMRASKFRGMELYKNTCKQLEPRWCMCRCVMTPPKGSDPAPISGKCRNEPGMAKFGFCSRDSVSFPIHNCGSRSYGNRACKEACENCLAHQKDVCGHERGWGYAILDGHRCGWSSKRSTTCDCQCNFGGKTGGGGGGGGGGMQIPDLSNSNPCVVQLGRANEDNGFDRCTSTCNKFLDEPDARCDVSDISNVMLLENFCDFDPDQFPGCRCTCKYGAGSGGGGNTRTTKGGGGGGNTRTTKSGGGGATGLTAPPPNRMNPCSFNIRSATEDTGFNLCRSRCQFFLTTNNPMCDLSDIQNPQLQQSFCDLDPDTFPGCQCTCRYTSGPSQTTAGGGGATTRMPTAAPTTTVESVETTAGGSGTTGGLTAPPPNPMNPCSFNIPGANEDNGFNLCRSRCEFFLTTTSAMCDLSEFQNPQLQSSFCDLDPDSFPGCQCTCTYIEGPVTDAPTTMMTPEPTTTTEEPTTPTPEPTTVTTAEPTTPAPQITDVSCTLLLQEATQATSFTLCNFGLCSTLLDDPRCDLSGLANPVQNFAMTGCLFDPGAFAGCMCTCAYRSG